MSSPTTNPKNASPLSMSARAGETRAEVSRLDNVSLSQMQIRLARWGVLLDTLEADTLAGGGNAPCGDGETIAELKANYHTACLGFDELKTAGLSKWEAFAASLQLAWSHFEATASKLEIQRGPKPRRCGCPAKLRR